MGRRGALRRGCCAAARRDRGAAAVEFALVALPLFALLFGIIQYGFLFFQVQGAASAARDAAGWAAVGIDNCGSWEAKAKKRAEANGVGDDLAPDFTASYDYPATGDAMVTVSLTFTPLQLVPLIPVPDEIVRTAAVDVQSRAADGVTTSCP
ncbi:MAG: pilus assembly protein [Actinobacteria bacterium]|nr:pilus assembly protein [Actinomycetota bacterium]